MPDTDVFPKLRSCTKLTTNHRIFDVKFYPFGLADDDHIFAAVAETDAYICRPRLEASPPYDILRFFRDDETYDGQAASYNCVAWTKHPATDKPLLAIAGSVPKHIKLIEVETGKIWRTLSGHGKGINFLEFSPLSTKILVSCAEDGTIRLWNLSAEYETQPCVALLGGEGHKQPILALNFHSSGRWLLSGGIDTAVALWAVPSLEELERGDNKDDEPKIIYYPHFYSEEVHSNYVDCLAFYGDLIISRAASDRKANDILIWKITGFNSSNPAPSEPAIPAVGQSTRSAFPHDPQYRGFERLVTFAMASTDRFYLRFGLFHRPAQRPILAMGNQTSKFHFFDLQKLDEGIDARDEGKSKRGRGRKQKASVAASRAAEEPPRQAEQFLTPETLSTPAFPERTFVVADPFRLLHADHVITANTKLSERNHFGTTQIDWSPDGTWMVAVGDYGMMCIFHRDRQAVNK